MGIKRWKKREGGKTTTNMNILKVNMALTQCFTDNFGKTWPSKVHGLTNNVKYYGNVITSGSLYFPATFAWPPALALAPSPSPQLVFTGPGPKFVFTGPDLPFYYKYGTWGSIYRTYVSSICIRIYGPGAWFVLSFQGLNLHLPYYW